MARLAIDKDSLDNYSKRDKSVQEAIDKFAAYTDVGLQPGKINYCKDYRIGAIRIDLSWRGVAPETGDTVPVQVIGDVRTGKMVTAVLPAASLARHAGEQLTGRSLHGPLW